MSILNKEQFCMMMKSIEDADFLIDDLNQTFRDHKSPLRIEYLPYTYDDLLLTLQVMFEDNDSGLIPYWCFELDFGKKYKDGCIQEKDGTNIVLKTPEDLYDALIKEMNKDENKL